MGKFEKAISKICVGLVIFYAGALTQANFDHKRKRGIDEEIIEDTAEVIAEEA